MPPSSHLGWVWGGFLLYPLPGGGAAAGPAEKLGGGGISHHPQPNHGVGLLRVSGKECN